MPLTVWKPRTLNQKTMNKFVAIAIAQGNWWVILSAPCTKEQAQGFSGCQMSEESFDVVTLEQAITHDKVLGREYLSE